MKSNLKYLLLVLAFLSSTGIFSQTAKSNCKTATTTVNGVYKGKNIFFENRDTDGIQKILLNNKEVASNINTKTFELKLSDLKIGQAFELKIIYCEMIPAPYKILNPEEIK